MPNLPIAASWLSLLLVGACADTREVSVGHASPLAIDPGACHATDCSQAVGSAMVDEAGATRCDPGTPRIIDFVWQERFIEPVPCEQLGSCLLHSFRIALAPDDSLWAAALVSSPESDSNVAGVWLAHYAADGEQLGSSIVDFAIEERDDQVVYYVDHTVDRRGHVFLAAHKAVATGEAADRVTQSWLAEYDPQGEQVGERMPVVNTDGPLHLSEAGTDSVAIGRSIGGGIALLGSDRMLRWTQSQGMGMDVRALASDAQSRVSAYGSHIGRFASEDSVDIVHYDSDGRLLWDLTLAQYLSPEDLGIDRDGNLIRAGYKDVPFGPGSSTLFVHKISPAGDSLWLREIPTFPRAMGLLGVANARATADASGTLYLPGKGPIPGAAETAFTLVYQIAPAGQTCRILGSQGVEQPMVEQLEATAAGELFFASGYGFGRFQTPAPVE